MNLKQSFFILAVILLNSLIFVSALMPDGPSVIIASNQTAPSDTTESHPSNSVNVTEIPITGNSSNIRILFPAQNQIIEEDFIEFRFILENNTEFDYCQLKIIKETNKIEYHETLESPALNKEYTLEIKNFENNEYSLHIDCIALDGQRTLKKNLFTIMKEPEETEESEKEEEVHSPKSDSNNQSKNLSNSSQLPEKTEEVKNNTPECSSGCEYNGRCIPIGTRLTKGDKESYCEISGSLENQKEKEESCQNDFECLSGECKEGRCISLQNELEETNKKIKEVESRVEEQGNMIERIFKFLRGLVGFD